MVNYQDYYEKWKPNRVRNKVHNEGGEAMWHKGLFLATFKITVGGLLGCYVSAKVMQKMDEMLEKRNK